MDFGNKDPPAYSPMASAPVFPSTPQQQPPIIMTPPTTNVTNVTVTPMYTGGCPVCHTGKFTGHFTCCGWLCCIFLFPIGIICCWCMRKRRCNNCGFQPS